MITSLTQPKHQRVALGATYEGRDPELLERMLPFVDYIEVTPETIAEFDGDRVSISKEILSELKNLRQSVGFMVHGVGLSIGSHEGWNPTYFRLLDEVLANVEVAWHSEHLGYTKVDGEHLGIMLAMPKTQESLDMLCERVAAIQARYPLPFLLENIVHVIPDSPAPYSDAAFLNALARQTGCGLILDVYNLQCDAHNHGFDISAFLDELDIRHVREMHVACGVEHAGFLLDVHSQLTRPSTIELAQSVLARPADNVKVVTYEFMPEAVPGLGHEAIAREFQRLRAAFNF
jgi:uncharacterized protein (UPF0276 family)